MKKYNIIAITVTSLILILGLIGAVVKTDDIDDIFGEYEHMYNNPQYDTMGFFNQGEDSYNHMGQDYQTNNSYGHMTNGNQGFLHGRMMSGMHQSYAFSNNSNRGEKIDVEQLKQNVKEYISQYNNTLEISDVFIYDKSDYYFSIIEEETGRGAMELLVNPYTGAVYPEFGPNMMWDLKYGMHKQNNYAVMGGMRGSYGRYDDYSYSELDEVNELTRIEAYAYGSEYILNNISETALLSEDAHAFYGYYTFHIEEANKTIGMLSVNGYSGDVWYHDWHGELIELIEGHQD